MCDVDKNKRFPERLLAWLLGLALAAWGCGMYTDQTRLDQCVLDPACSRSLVVAHRGVIVSAPENTVAGILQAWEDGADMVEIDVRTSADGALVLMHDSTIDRTTDGAGFVSAMSLDELRAVTVYSPDPNGPCDCIPTLNEALGAVVGRMLCLIDLKDADPREVVDAMRAAGALDACALLTPSYPVAAAVKWIAPDVTVASWAYDWRGVTDLVYRSETELIVMAERVARPDLLAQVEAAGRKSVVSMVGIQDLAILATPDQACAYLEGIGADLVLTDFVARLLPYVDPDRGTRAVWRPES